MSLHLVQELQELWILASLKSLGIGLLAGAAVLLARNVNLRHRITAAAMLSMLLMPMLVSATPTLAVPILSAMHESSAELGAAARAVVPDSGFVGAFSTPTPNSATSSAPAPEQVAGVAVSTAAPAFPTGALIQVAVTLLLLARLVLSVLGARALVRTSRPLATPAGLDLGRAQLRESASVRVPLMMGVLRPTILLPAAWASWSDTKLESVLTHEAAHARRGDWLVALLSELNVALFWFHPLAWVLRRALADTAEECCDDAVLERTGDRAGYASVLLDFAKDVTRGRRVAWGARPATLSMARRPLVERRIDSILAQERPLARRLGPRVGAALGAVALMTTLGAACMVPVSPDQDPAAVPATSAIELSDTPGVSVDGAPALLIRALDAATGEPIDEFLAIAGVDVREEMISAACLARHGKDAIVNWQSHTIREGQDGEYRWPLRRVYPKLGLRVEAVGYVPQRYTWIDKSRGAQTIVFRLQKDPGITGRAVLPDGEPAAGAEIGVHMTSRGLRLKGASLGFGPPIPKDTRARWSRGVVVKADAQGRFRLPSETDPTAYLVAVHAAGTCQVLLDDFAPKKPLKLIAWGRVEGTVLIGKRPGANAKVTVYDDPPRQSVYPSPLSHHYDLRSDASGRFVIERFPHGVGAVALPEYIPVNDGTHPAGFSYIPPIPKNAMGRFHVKAGETTVVTIGGEGLGPKIEDSSGKKR